jgi:hypothetical protein
MRLRLGHWILSGVAVLATLAAAPSARADFDIMISSGGTTIFQSIDNTLEDDNPTTDQIGLSSAALSDLNAALSGAGLTLQFTSLAATTNRGSSSPFANLTVNGEVQGIGTVEIAVSATDYNFPAGTVTTINSSGAETFTGAGDDTNGLFTSYFNQSNTQDARETATGTLFFAPTPGTTVSSSMGTLISGTLPLVIPGATLPYSLTNVTTLNVTGDANTKLQFQGTTTVTAAVPEPASMALMLFGGAALAARKIRRRKPIA